MKPNKKDAIRKLRLEIVNCYIEMGKVLNNIDGILKRIEREANKNGRIYTKKS